jgi:hypothetical protein
MRQLREWVLVAVMVALAPSPALAQGRRPPGGGQLNAIMLLSQPSVQKDLKMTEEQVAKVKKALKSRQAVREELKDLDPEARAKRLAEITKENDKLAAEILNADQTKRLRQIYLQQQGVNALTQPEIANELKLTDEQKKKLQDVQKKAAAQVQALRRPGAGEEAMEKIGELTKAFNEEAQKILTDEQKAKWKQLTGEPFKGQLRLAMPGDRPAQRPDR